MRKFNLTLLGVASLLAACESPEATSSNNGKSNGISFQTAITRAVGNQWETNDSVGVFQLPNGATFDKAIGKNVTYSTPEGDGNFTSKKPLHYPEGSNTVYDFVAYYPYQKGITKNYPVEVSNQSQINKLDLLYAKTTNQNETNTKVNLQFKHCLSNLVVEVKAGKDVESLEKLTVTLTGSPTQGIFNLETGTLSVTDNSIKDIALNVSISSDKQSAKAEAIVIPSSWTGNTLVFKVPEQGTFTYTFKEGAFLTGKKYKLVATLSKEGTIHGIEVEGLNNSIDNWNTEGGDMGSIDENFSGSGTTEPNPDPEPDPNPDESDGNGTKDKPYSVAQMLNYKTLNIKKDVYVKGYIVGVHQPKGSLFMPFDTTEFETWLNKESKYYGNFLLAGTSTERSAEKLFSITGYKTIADAKQYLIPKLGEYVTILIKQNQLSDANFMWIATCSVMTNAAQIPLTFK